MRNNLNTLIFIITLIIFGSGKDLYAQNAAACNAMQTICGNPAFSFTSTSGFGLPGSSTLTVSNPTNPQLTNAAGGPQNSGCMYNTNAPNPEWLLLNITSSGNLGFVFGAASSANPQTNYMNWIMWPYTANSCANIFNNTLPPVACNYNCTAAGGTGMGTIPALGNACNYQPSIAVTQGQQYLILISNGSGTVKNVSFSVTGTAGVSCNPLTVPNLTACPGQQAVATATWLGASNVTYTVIPCTGPTIIQSSPNFSISSPATCVFTVLASGTNVFAQPITATQNLTLTINPTSTISVTQDTNYCYNSTPTIVLAPCTGGTFVVSGPGYPLKTYTTCPIVLDTLISPVNNGQYTITGTQPTGCTVTATAQINIAPNNFITATGTINACVGGNVNLTASMPTATSYTWFGPAFTTSAVVLGVNGNTTIANIPVSSAGVYTVAANIIYNGIKCLRTNTTQVNVVQTYTIDAQSSYTYCQGTQAVLTASAANAVSYSWSGPLGFSATLPSSITSTPITNSVVPGNAGNYIVTAFFSNGYTTCPTTAVATISVVTVNPVSILVPTLICQYSTANIAISAVAPAGETVSGYGWSGPGGFTSTSPSTVITNIQPPQSGVYTGTVIYSIGTRTCSASGSNQITVVPVNTVSVNSPTPVCRPDNVNLYSNALGATSYSWAGPNSYTAGTANTILYYPPITASGIYTAFVTFTNVGITCHNTNTVSVSVNAVPSFTIIDYLQGCYNTTVTVQGPVDPTYTYAWSSTTGFTSTTQNLVLAPAAPAQSGIYALTVSQGPCASTKSVQINILTPVQFTLTPDSRTVCADSTVLLIAGCTGGSQNYAYDWNPSTYLSAPTGSFITGIMKGTTVYNVTARDIACPNYTISYAFTILVNQPPVPDLRIQVTEGCQPLYVPLNPRTNAAITTYDFGGNLKFQGIQGDTTFGHTFFDAGTYHLKVLSEGTNGCIGTYYYPDAIIVDPKSSSDIQWSPDVPTSTENLVTFNAVPKYGTIAFYNWMFTGTGASGYDTSNLKSPQRKFENTGRYPVLLITTTDKGCTDTTIKYLDIRDELTLFIPNTFTPNSDGINDIFQVKGLGFKVDHFSLEILDRWNNSIFSTTEPTKGWDGTIKGQAPVEGVYIYKVNLIGTNGEGRKEYIGYVTLLK